MDDLANSSVPADDAAVLSQALSGLEGENPTSTVPAVAPAAPVDSTPTPVETPVFEAPQPAASTPVAEPAVVETPTEPATTPASEPADPLDDLRQTAIGELKSLIGHVNLKPTDKFDAYLMLIRSTDDTSLIAPAHEAALAITDDQARSQALINIIKEIDYLTHHDS